MLPEDLLLRKVLFLKVCELLENTFPNLREGDNDDDDDNGDDAHMVGVCHLRRKGRGGGARSLL